MTKKPRGSQNKNRKQDLKNTEISQKDSSKRSWGIIGKIARLIAFILTLIGAYIAYVVSFEARIIATLNNNHTDIINTDFIFTNEGYYFTLHNVNASMYITEAKDNKKNISVHHVCIEQFHMLYLGSIDPRQHSTGKIFSSLESMGFTELERADICFYVQYTVLFAFFKFNKEQEFGFFADKKSKTDHFIRRECKGGKCFPLRIGGILGARLYLIDRASLVSPIKRDVLGFNKDIESHN